MDISNIKVFVVDDEIVVCSNVAAFLEDEGFTVFSATSGEEALDFLLKQKIDVAIIDIRLPGIDGDMLIFKAHEIQPVLKFLIHTGSTNYFRFKITRSNRRKKRTCFSKAFSGYECFNQRHIQPP